MRTAISPGAHGEARAATLMDVQRGPPRRDGPRAVESRRRPTLPGGLPPSTIGAGGLNCRVRNGNGCCPAAMATGNCAPEGEPSSVLERARASNSKPSAD